MLLQRVRLEAVGRPVKVVVADAADEAFSLQGVKGRVSPGGKMNLSGTFWGTTVRHTAARSSHCQLSLWPRGLRVCVLRSAHPLFIKATLMKAASAFDGPAFAVFPGCVAALPLANPAHFDVIVK